MYDRTKHPSGPFVETTGRTQQREFLKWPNPLVKSKALAPGYGTLPQGLVLAKNVSAAGRKDLLIPYSPNDYTSILETLALRAGRSFLFADVPASAMTTLNIRKEDAGKFVVGDEVIIQDNDTTAEELGPITVKAIVDPYCILTFASVTPSAVFAIADQANIYVKGGASAPFSDAVGILTEEVETGDGTFTQTSIAAPVAWGHSLIQTWQLVNLDAAAITALGGRVDGDDFWMP